MPLLSEGHDAASRVGFVHTERLGQKEVLDRETGMVSNVKTTTTYMTAVAASVAPGPAREGVCSNDFVSVIM